MRRIRFARTTLAALLAVMCAALPARAQTLTGTILGRVADQQGGVLPGVTVTLTGKTGSQTQVTDARGEFRFVGLEVGNYGLKAELQGFRPKQEPMLDLGIGKTIDLRLDLQVSGVSENVSVVGSSTNVDTTTTATDTTLSQELLFSMPISRTNAAVNIMNNAPGINNGSAYGGGANTGSSLMLDGVDTRDPEGGSAWTFFNYNIMEEVQVGGLGAAAEYGGFTGAVVNVITKSGGNRFSSLAEMRFSNTSLSGNNLTAGVKAANPSLGNAAVIKKLTDYTVQLGGPLKKDKAFFFGSIQRYSVQDDPSGPRTLHTEVSPRFNGKFTFLPSPSDNIVVGLQYDSYNQTGRSGLAGSNATQQQTVDQDSPEVIYNLQYRKVLGSSTFFEAKYTGYGWAYYDLNPIDSSPAHLDDNGDWTGGGGFNAQYDRTRNQVNAALSKYADFKGAHNLKFGAEIERSKIRNRYAYSGNIQYYDLGGLPYLAYSYAYDVKGTIKRNSFYAQDQWKLGRATLNYGARVDQIHGDDTNKGTQLYSTTSFGPRLGVAIDVMGTGRSVLRGSYGRLYEGANFSPFERSVSGIGDTITYDVGPGFKTLTENNRVSGASKYRVDPNIKQVGLDEFQGAFEQQLAPGIKFTATGVYRNNINFQNSVLPAARWTPTARTNPLTNQPLTVYRWANRAVGEQYLITNYAGFQYLAPDGSVIGTADPYRRYYGAILMLQKAMTHRWAGQISYVWARTQGTVDNTGANENQTGSQFQTPNRALINADGFVTNDRTHELKTYVSYQIPVIEVGLNAYHRFVSGSRYTPVQRLSGSVINYSSSVNVFLEPFGSRRNDNLSIVDLRAEKLFNAGVNRFGVYVDVANLFNAGTITSRQTRYPNRSISGSTVLFADPTAVTPARQATVGIRWSF